MSKGEDVMKPNKEQKGKNAVLVIAVGKHPKMGPGERGYKKDKSMKKAFAILKQKKTADERKKAYEERKARREQREKEMDAYNAGTASEEVKQKIEQSRANTESGANQNLRFADKNKGGSQQKRMPKKPFDTSVFDRWVKNNSLSQKDNDRISSDNAMELAHRTGIKLQDIQSKNFDKYDIGALKQAMQAMGKENYEKRQKARLNRQDRRQDNLDVSTEADINYDDLDEEFNDERLSELQKPNIGAKGRHLDAIKRIAMARGLTVQQVENMMGGDFDSEGYESDDKLNVRGDIKDDGEDSQLRRTPSDFTTPFATREGTGFKSGSMRNPEFRGDISGERGSSFKPGQGVEDTMHGFKPPVNYGFARVGDNPLEDEEVNMDEVQDMMNQKAEPMELAFRLLKNSMCKGSDDCDCPKCCETDDEDNDKAFFRACDVCGGVDSPANPCRCRRR